MITGVVMAREARIRLKVRGPRRQEREIEAVIDSGHTAFLVLPTALIATLSLRCKSLGRGILADGSECVADGPAGKMNSATRSAIGLNPDEGDFAQSAR